MHGQKRARRAEWGRQVFVADFERGASVGAPRPADAGHAAGRLVLVPRVEAPAPVADGTEPIPRGGARDRAEREEHAIGALYAGWRLAGCQPTFEIPYCSTFQTPYHHPWRSVWRTWQRDWQDPVEG
jgi:hypothetical protein